MLPPLLDVESIRGRLQVIFPEGTPERSKCTGLAAARTIYVMLYVGAIEGGEWLAPKYVYRMGNSQAAKTSDLERAAYLTAVKKPGTPEPADRWYKENTRKSIRDEALKNGLVPIGAVLINPHVPTTSSHGRYILRGDLAALFDPSLTPEAFEIAAATWRGKYLTPNALATVKVLQVAAAGAKAKVPVMLPSGEGRVMVPGLSSVITKAVVEVFAPRFLKILPSCGSPRAAVRWSKKTTSCSSCSASRSAPKSCCPTSSWPTPQAASCCSCSWRWSQPTALFTKTVVRLC